METANNVYDLPSTEQGIKWMHAVCGYPVKSTWLKAIAAGNFIGWPLLTTQNVKKYYPETTVLDAHFPVWYKCQDLRHRPMTILYDSYLPSCSR